MEELHEQEYSGRFNWELWKKLLAHVAAYRMELIILGLVMVAVAAVEAVFPLLTKYAIDTFIVPGNLDGIHRFLTAYAGVIIFQTLNIWLFISRAGRIETGVSHDIRDRGFRRLQELSLSYYDRTPAGWLMARMTSDTLRLSEALAWGLVDMIWGGAMMLAITIAMFALNWRLALIALSVVPVLAVLSIFFQKKILSAFRDVRRINSRITGAFNEGIMGARTTKTLVRETGNLKEFGAITGRLRTSSVRAAVFSALFLPVAMTLGSIGTGLALWFGGERVLAGAITYGTLVAFLSYTVQFFEPVRELARIFAELQSAQAAAERVLSMIESRPEIEDPPEVRVRYGDTFNPRPETWPPVKGRITFRDVSFRYREGEEVLHDFNLDVRAGENVALIGETGSGKSTIVNLACRFYEPTAGTILIDGTDYRHYPQIWLHSHLGYVLQNPHLFSGTVRVNIRYGDLEADDEQVVRAARTVNAHRFITELKDGYDTDVGESGDMLSTGQKQLISFARAIVKNPRFLVLDEATSSIDTEMERIIQQAIARILRGRTCLIIAHRLSTIVSADRILVLREGRVVEEGSHRELVDRGGYYTHLYESQFDI